LRTWFFAVQSRGWGSANEQVPRLGSARPRPAKFSRNRWRDRRRSRERPDQLVRAASLRARLSGACV